MIWGTFHLYQRGLTWWICSTPAPWNWRVNARVEDRPCTPEEIKRFKLQPEPPG